MHIRIILATLVLTGSMRAESSAEAPGDPQGIPFVQLEQLNWIGDCGKPDIPASAVGRAVFTFSAADPDHQQFLAANGGGYINVLLWPDGGDLDWVVQNLYVAYPDAATLDGAGTSVLFRLPGIEHGQEVLTASYGTAITDQPLATADFVVDSDAEVFLYDHLTGGGADDSPGFLNGGSGCSDLPSEIGNWCGTTTTTTTSTSAWIGEVDDYPPIDEKLNHCVPASTARSLDYLIRYHDLTRPKNGDGTGMSSQQMESALATVMETTRADGTWFIAPGTKKNKALIGKNKFVAEHSLPIETRFPYTSRKTGAMPAQPTLDDAMTSLADKCDVELVFARKGGGFHMVFVTQITRHEDANGTVTGYTIDYVDDAKQDNGQADEVGRSIHIKPDGTFKDCLNNRSRGTLQGVMMECINNPRIELVGACPGPVTVRGHGATPGARVALVYGACDGQTTVPSPPCAGTVVPVGNARLVKIVVADANGNFEVSGVAPASACGKICLVAVNLDTCEVGNVIPLK
ncbi:MAG: hypothetical protein D8M59_08245 [Planctomycetes bacterium]|nr:hypothetical protein [Planctomycetota bacterium]